MRCRVLYPSTLLLALIASTLSAFGKTTLSVAAAANLVYALESLNAEFRRAQPDAVVETTMGASGNLFAQLNSLDWDSTPVHASENTGHGRAERRTIRVRPAPEDIDFPHTAQVFLIERYVTDTKTGKKSAIAVENQCEMTFLSGHGNRRIGDVWLWRLSRILHAGSAC